VAHYAHVGVADETKLGACLASPADSARGYCRRGAPAPNLSATEYFSEVALMILRDRMVGFVCMLALAPLAGAGDARERSPRAAAPLEIPHTTNLDLDFKARKRNRRPDNIESSQLLESMAGMEPLIWPRNGDVRARLVTPQLRSTPVVGWIASSLYRSRKDTGWCLEVDPGEGEYLVFYRRNLK
jgi:hypothetical protein